MAIYGRVHDEAMDETELDERMAEARLRLALVDHIEETEPVPPEVSQAVREMYVDRPTL